MPKSDNQKGKLFALYRILHDYTDENNGLSMAEIITKLESDYAIIAERRSIASDLAVLETVFHIEVEARKRDTTRYHLKTRPFSFSDVMSLTNSIQANNVLTGLEVRALIEKLKTFCSNEQAKQIQIQANLTDSIQGITIEMREKIDMIQSAISEDVYITFSYPNYYLDGTMPFYYEKRHSVKPLSILHTDGKHYLFGRNFYSEKSNFYYYKIEKMESMSVSYPYKMKQKDKEELEKIRAENHDWEAYPIYDGWSWSLEEVSMRFSNKLLEAVIDRFGLDVKINPIDDNHFRVVHKVVISTEFFGWLFSMGTGARLLSPLQVTQKFKKWLKDVHELYQVPAKLSNDG